MRSARLLVVFLSLLVGTGGNIFSQVDPSMFVDVLSQDSLAGFDEQQAKQNAVSEGLYGINYTNAIRLYKRQFVINKYNLYHAYIPQGKKSALGSGSKYGGASVNVAPCNNEGFETGTLAGWSASTGINTNSQAYPSTPTPILMGSQCTVVSLPFNDPFVGSVPPSPFSGNRAVRINDQATGAVVVKLAQTFPVTTSNYVFEFAYWAVMEDAPNHNCAATPYMQVRFLNNAGSLQNCPSFSIIAPGSGGGCGGIGPLTWTTIIAGGKTVRTSSGWQKFSVDLGAYITSPLISNVTAEIIVGDCQATGHFGYAYFDSNCNMMNLTVNTTSVSMPSPTVFPQVQCGSTATLGAPGGFAPFLWKGPPGSGVTGLTTQTVTTAVPGNYTLEMSPVGICNPPLTKIVNLQFVPPTTVTASPANICTTGPNTVSTLSAAGAAQYTWMPGGSNLSSIVVTPTSTSVYTLTARTGTCLGTYTIEVTVNPDPVFNVVSSNANVCPGQPATLTAISAGSNTYSWSPIGVTGSVVTISQSSATTYTTIGTSTAGCISTVTTSIGMLPAPLIQIFLFTPTLICSGDPVSMIATGGSIVWQPGNVASPNAVFNPTVTTTYTAVGTSGSCTNSATQLITVDPGPSMTLSANPVITCPGNTTTLSVVAPAAVGAFTWNPGAINASSIVVTPTLAGGYSVTAKNALGCPNTQTINPTISPLPNLSISPVTPTVCDGNSATVTAFGAVSYTWDPVGITSNPAVLTPTGTSSYTLIGANGAGCVNQFTFNVTVINNPTVNASVTPTAICAGGCATINPGGAASYNISGGSMIVCPATSSVYLLTGTNAQGCVSAPLPVSVTVNSNPVITASANPSSICAGSSSTLTANGGVSYVWSPGGPGSQITVTPPSSQTYTVTGTNAASCSSSVTVNVTVIPSPTVNVTPAAATICAGGAITPTATGATNYTWNPGPLTGASPLLSPSGTTTYTIVGATGACTGQTQMLVTVAPSPVITATYLPGAICAGSCATLNTTGTATTFIISGGLSAIACPTINTFYTVFGIDLNGCASNTVSGTLFVNPVPSITATANQSTICAGGSSTLTGLGAISYTWTDGTTPTVAANVVVSPSSTRNYTLTGDNASGCTTTTFVTVNVISTPVIVITPASATICPGGAITPTATGATNYTWNPGPLTGASPVLSPSGTTTYSIIGATGACTGQTQMVVTVAPSPVITASYVPGSICAGSCATLQATGTVTNFIVTGGLSNPVACPAATTNYSVVGVNVFGCLSNTVTGTLVVNNSSPITATANQATICSGASSTLTATGAVSYTWTDGSTPSVALSVIVSPASTRSYTVSGTNAFGCISTTFVTVNVISPPTIGVTPSSATICSGGIVTPTATGGISYTWNPGPHSGASPTLSPATSTTYTIIGFNGACSGQTTMAVFVAPVPVITASYVPGSICAGSCSTLQATGTVTNFIVSGGLSNPVACPIATSNYSVVGVNIFGCLSNTVTGTLIVNNSTPLVATAAPASVCPGGSSNLSATGAVTYTWTDGITPSVTPGVAVTPSSTRSYTVTGANAFGCISSTVVSVVVVTLAPMTATASPASICAGANATLSANGSGSGTYTWMPGFLTGQVVFVNPPSTTVYTVTGNTGGCTATTTVAVNVNSNPTVNVNPATSTICAGGVITITLTGANTYNWSDGSTAATRTLSPSGSTVFTIFGTSSAGCVSGPASATITVNSVPAITASATPGNICAGASVTLDAAGATSYNWQPANLNGSTVVDAPAISTVYTVTGTGGGGCTGTATVLVNVTSPVSLTASAVPATVCTGGTVNLIAGGATNYTWLPGPLPALANITVTPSGSTTYTVTGVTGPCSAQSTVAVTVISPPSVTISASSLSICSGGCATLTASGAGSYAWSNGITTPVNVVCPTANQTYTVIGSIGSCTGISVASIVVNSVPSVSITSSANPLCSGSSANLTALGATNYTWSTGSLLSSISVAPSTNSVYSVTGETGGCTSTATIMQNVLPGAAITISATSPSVCSGYTVGLTASAIPVLSYTWSPGGFVGSAFTDTPTGTTVYTVSADNSGCISTATISILVQPLPSVTLTANPSSLCPGVTATLTASGAANYTWIPSLLGGNTFTDNPTVTTEYTVVGFSAAGCPNYATATVTIVAPPVINVTASSPSVCPGSSATLTASGATNYSWSPISQSGSTVIVNPSVATTYTVVGDNGGCTTSLTIPVGIYNLPNITAAASSASICPGNTVGLTASGGVNYTWTPPNLTGASIVDAPGASVTYTALGEDANGCINTGTVFVFVTPMVGVSAVANPTAICEGGTATLTGAGGLSYTWNPGGQVMSQVTVTPNISTTYSLHVTDATGCTGIFTVDVIVYPNPTISVSPLNPTICAGTSETLTATGAANYTWLPSGANTSVVIESPIVQTNYTVLADNGGLCFTSFTFDIFVNPLPQNVAAISSGTISCVNQTVFLAGTSTDTNVSYFWTGPQSFSSSVQNPTVVSNWGTFTLTVTDNVTGCSASTTVDVPTDNSIPLVTAVSSGSITCAIPTVTLNAVNTTTNPGYNWTGPAGFTSTLQTNTVTIAGDYTITITDLSSSCTASAVVTVGSHTRVLTTASISPATCNGSGGSNNDGSISVSNYTVTDKYDLVSGLTYTGSATYATAATIPVTGIITSNLANPSTTVAYTIRLFDAEGCVKDTTLFLIPVDCSLNTLGIAKAVSDPVLNSDGSYNVTYTVVVKNHDGSGMLKDISLVENLASTFPAPTTFSVIDSTFRISGGSGLTLNKPGFDGSSQTFLLAAGANTLAPLQADTIRFVVKVRTPLFFIDFNNTVLGTASNMANTVLRDSSQAGLNPDPDGDNNPSNNNLTTKVRFSPNLFFGITKTGEIHKSDDESYDITYTVTVHNLGNDTIRNVSLKDSLFGKTIRDGASYSIRSGPVSSGDGLVANSMYDGNTNSNLVDPLLSRMSPKTVAYIYFTINVVPGNVVSISNSAYGSALCAISATENIVISDTSNAGTDPDVNDNGIWNEAVDNVPTVLLVPITESLFVPEGFSPDGDNINQYFVIQGLPTDGDNTITIFNRWGNKVYQKANYDNTWDGTPNVAGTLGKDKLPPGTYYYVLEMKGSKKKTITGFVVLQY